MSLKSLGEVENAGLDNLHGSSIQQDEHQDSKDDFVVKLYTRRWFVLAGFCLVSLSNYSLYFSFSAISNIAQKYYGIDAVSVNWLAMVFSAVMFVLMLPCNYFLEKKGLFITMLLSSFLNAIGCCIRYIGLSFNSSGYWFLLFGNIICAVCSAAHVFLPSKIAALWFGEKERATAASIAVSANSLGLALGYLLPTSMVKNRPIVEDIGEDLGHYLLSNTVLASTTFIYIIIAIKDRPKSAPSYSEALKHRPRGDLGKGNKSNEPHIEVLTLKEKQRNENIHFQDEPKSTVNDSVAANNKHCFKALLKNKHFHVILQLRSVTYAVEVVFLTTLNEILIPRFPGHELEVGLMGATALLLSIPSSVLVGILLDRTRAFKKITIVTTFLVSLLTGLLTAFFYLKFSFYSLFCTYLAIMTVHATYYVTALDHCAELTYPVSEARSSVILQMGSQIYSFIFARIAGSILLHFSSQVLLIGIQCLYILTFSLSFIVKSKGSRSDF